MDGSGLASIAASIDLSTPQFTSASWLQLIILLVSLFLCAMASAAETALTSISRIKLKNLVEEGDKQAIEIDRMLSNPNKLLSTILIVNSVAVIVASSMATVLALQFFGNLGELIGTILISLVVLILCEITPKTAAVQNPLRWARIFVNPVRGAAWLLTPIVWTLSAITNFLVRDLVRTAYFVPEMKKLDDLLREIKQKHVHMVIIVDEYGSVAGLVTIEDLVEEIVGDIQDEYDREEKLYEQVSENEYIFNAKISIEDFNDLMEQELEDSDYETLGGFLYAQLDKIPTVGDTITFNNLTFTVLSTRGRRITQVRVIRKADQQTMASQEGGEYPSGPFLLPSPRERREAGKNQDKNETSEQPSPFEYRGA